MNTSNSSQALAQVLSNIADGSIKVVDLTQPLGEDTPVIGLPPEFAQSPPFSREVISKYNETGPAWYWNIIHVGEHTGTHFDAPAHWISGKDLPNNTLDTIPYKVFCRRISGYKTLRSGVRVLMVGWKPGLP